MECKKCGIDLSGRDYRNVAQWPFCLDCFEALMNKAEAPKDDTVNAPVPEPDSKRKRCLICDTEIAEGAGRELAGLTFCLPCYENLVNQPDIPPRTKDDTSSAGMGRQEKPAVAQVRIDVHRPIPCSGCGRQIPGVGSKQFNGKPYCPDCYYALPEIKAQKPRPFPSAASAQQVKAEHEQPHAEEQAAGLQCQACGRYVLPASLKMVEGFELCLACLTTDPDTALRIARTRHRQTLDRLKKELDV